MVEYIKHDSLLLAIIVRSGYSKPGICFFTEDTDSQQLAFMKHPTGKSITPHVHMQVPRNIELTKEVLFIRSGRLRVDFYDSGKNYLESRRLESGDVILLSDGGHGFYVEESVEMFEVKQGPYAGEADKVRFAGVDASSIKLLGGSV
jgi:mannose-6-phosphate isomerase-like protein (cupin superfamily)